MLYKRFYYLSSAPHSFQSRSKHVKKSIWVIFLSDLAKGGGFQPNLDNYVIVVKCHAYVTRLCMRSMIHTITGTSNLFKDATPCG